jgi:hypothetical protein
MSDKEKLIKAIRKKLSKTELPKELILSEWAKITDVEKFFDSHLSIVQYADKKLSKTFAEVLKIALRKVGIDVHKLAKEINKKGLDKNSILDK